MLHIEEEKAINKTESRIYSCFVLSTNLEVSSGSTGVDTFDANVFLRFCVNSIRAGNLSSAGTSSGASSSIKI